MGVFGTIGKVFNKIPGTKQAVDVTGKSMGAVEGLTGLTAEQQMMLVANVGGLAMDVMSGNPVGAAADLASIYGDVSGNEQISNYADAIGAVSGIGSSIAAAAKTATKQVAKTAGKEAAKAAAKGAAKAATKEAAIEASKAAVGNIAKEGAKVALKPVAMEATKGVAKQAGQEVFKNALTDITKQGVSAAANTGLQTAAKTGLQTAAGTGLQTAGNSFLNSAVTNNPLAGSNLISPAASTNPVVTTAQNLFPGQDLKSIGSGPLAGTPQFPGDYNFANTTVKDIYGGPGQKTFGQKMSDVFKKTETFGEKYVQPAASLYGSYQSIQDEAQKSAQLSPQAQQMMAQIRNYAQPSFSGDNTVANQIARMHRGY